MTPKEAKERLRRLCIEAWDIADEQGWDCKVDARPYGREGYRVMVMTDRVDEAKLQARAQRKMQVPLEMT